MVINIDENYLGSGADAIPMEEGNPMRLSIKIYGFTLVQMPSP